jgi:hypothetical protein
MKRENVSTYSHPAAMQHAMPSHPKCTMKADGTPDMRYKANRAQASDALEQEHARALRRLAEKHMEARESAVQGDSDTDAAERLTLEQKRERDTLEQVFRWEREFRTPKSGMLCVEGQVEGRENPARAAAAWCAAISKRSVCG